MSEWIAVCGEEGSDPIEIETEDGKSSKQNKQFLVLLGPYLLRNEK
jgi:hypothetical protein